MLHIVLFAWSSEAKIMISISMNEGWKLRYIEILPLKIVIKRKSDILDRKVMGTR